MKNTSKLYTVTFILMIIANLLPILLAALLYRLGFLSFFLVAPFVSPLAVGCYFAASDWKRALILSLELLFSAISAYILMVALYVAFVSGDALSYVLGGMFALLGIFLASDTVWMPVCAKAIVQSFKNRRRNVSAENQT